MKLFNESETLYKDFENKNAVEIQNVYYSYKKDINVLDGITINIIKGKIFALLGSNGSGKTTLSRLILGLLVPKYGTIKLFNQTSNECTNNTGADTGYMPQDIAVCEELTIKEIMIYYGIIYNMKTELIERKINEFKDLLDLPKVETTICELSGGQQRLVSFAISLIHNPRLLILDEPTVGLDSMLRCSIWKYLENQCILKDLTVIITTHYIEEARNAANVGFIFNGKCLKQSNPDQLIRDYVCKTLEDVYLNICVECNENKKKENLRQVMDKNGKNFCDKKVYKKQNIIDLNHMKALIWKNLIRLKKRPFILFLFHILPVLLICGMNLCYGRPHNIPIAIYNEESEPILSKTFIESIDQNSIDIKLYKSNESAFDSVVNGENYLSIVFSNNFSDSFENRVLFPLEVSDEELDSSRVKVYANFSDAIGYFAYFYICKAFEMFFKTFENSIENNANQFSLPIKLKDTVYGGTHIDFGDYFASGFLIAITHALAIYMASLYSVNDRKNGVKERDIVTGISNLEVIFAQIFFITANIIIQALVIVFVTFKLFDYPLNGSIIEVYLLIVMVALQGMTTGLLISLIVRDDAKATIIATLVSCPLYPLCGIVWPIESLPVYLKPIVEYLPLTLPLSAMRSLMFRGWNIFKFEVLIGYLVCISYTLIISAINIFLTVK